MKIALACAVFPPEGSNGGMATFSLELSRALASLEHDVFVITLTDSKDRSETVDGVRSERIHFDDADYANLSNLGFLPFAAWYLSRAVHLHKRLLSAFDDMVETPYYSNRVNTDMQRLMEEVYQKAFTDGFQAGRRSIASNPAAALMDGLKYLTRFFKQK